jgi:hypothetical protein
MDGHQQIQALLGKWYDIEVGRGGHFGRHVPRYRRHPWQQQQQDQDQDGGWAAYYQLLQQMQQQQAPMPPPGPAPGVSGWYDLTGPSVGQDLAYGEPPIAPRAAVVDAPLPTQANRDILPMSTGVPILPTQSAQITGRPQTLVFKIGRFVISNAGTAGGSADWIVNDIKIGNVSQFVQSGDVPGDLFATNAIDTFVRFAPAQTAMDVVVVTTYIGLNESGCPFFGAMVGTAAV